MRSVQLVVLATALVAGACAREATEPEQLDAVNTQLVQVGDTIRLRVGGTARVGSSGVLVAFRGIAADSRCPIDALCVWAGDAEARIQLTVGRAAWTSTSLHSFIEPRSVEFADFTFRLIEVSPANVSTSRTDPDDYVIALEVRAR